MSSRAAETMIESARALEHASALDMARFAEHLAITEPERKAHTYALRGGHVVLTGPDMFVNAALGVGFDEGLTEADLDTLQKHADELGVPPTVEVSELSHPSVEPFLRAHGFVAGDARAGLVLQLDNYAAAPPERFEARAVESDADLARWQEAAATGWGHEGPARRAASDAFAATAHATQEPGLILAIDNTTNTVAGCAALSILGPVAILGGMSTLPDHRGHGVQRAMIEHRLELAQRADCTIAGTQAALGGGSMRNLIRAGFIHTHTMTSWRP